jgi:hypothetical protein
LPSNWLNNGQRGDSSRRSHCISREQLIAAFEWRRRVAEDPCSFERHLDDVGGFNGDGSDPTYGDRGAAYLEEISF